MFLNDANSLWLLEDISTKFIRNVKHLYRETNTKDFLIVGKQTFWRFILIAYYVCERQMVKRDQQIQERTSHYQLAFLMYAKSRLHLCTNIWLCSPLVFIFAVRIG